VEGVDPGILLEDDHVAVLVDGEELEAVGELGEDPFSLVARRAAGGRG
jgi:hypothetical protein